MNAWKLATIILVFVILFEVYLISHNPLEYKVRDFKIPKTQLNNIYNYFPGANSFVICDIENDKCAQIIKDN